jgi:ATP-dependent Clp protease ATP-binding subunit ClpB
MIESPTKSRLEEIEKEIQELKAKQEILKNQWNSEKSIIQDIRKSKADIELLKQKADVAEREGNLELVAKIRYGDVHSLEQKLNQANLKLQDIQTESKLLNEEVGAEDIADIISKWTGIPLQKMLETERTKLLKIEERLHQRLIGQEEAVSAVANAIRRSRAGLQDSTKPIGSFIFLGTTGVGKTELARALAEYLFDDEQAMVRIDMSEYMDKFSVTRLIGAPPGYVGYEEGGQLTEVVRKRPYAVVLLDEIEKANSDVFNVLLQLLDDGRLTDGKGRTVSFKNTIIIMTSNLGTEILQEKINEIAENENSDDILYKIKLRILDLLKSKMRPEFINRIDEIVLFKPLSSKEIYKIAEINLKSLQEKLSSNGIALQVDETAIEWLSKIGYDPQYGARPLKRAIQKSITDTLAIKLLSSEFVQGDKIKIFSPDTGGFKFEKVSES